MFRTLLSLLLCTPWIAQVAPAQPLWTQPVQGYHVVWLGSLSPIIVDLDGDGPNEMVILTQSNPVSEETGLLILEADGSVRVHTEVVGAFTHRNYASIFDQDDDGQLEIVMMGWRDRKPCLIVYDGDGRAERALPIATDYDLADIYEGGMVVADLDLDGVLDLVYSGSGYRSALGRGHAVVAVRRDGTLLPGFPTLYLDRPYTSLNTVAVGDLNGDPYPEIVATSSEIRIDDSAGLVVALDHEGGTLWQRSLPTEIRADPLIADLDGDGRNEVVVNSADGLYVFSGAGDVLLQADLCDLTPPRCYESNVALADFDGNGWLELVFSVGHYLYGMQIDGMLFMQDEIWTSNLNQPLIADADGDGDLDIVIAIGRIWILDQGGSVLSEILSPELVYSPPALGDLDGDGTMELVAGVPRSGDGTMYAWSLGAPYSPERAPWPMYRHDRWLTGTLDAFPDAERYKPLLVAPADSAAARATSVSLRWRASGPELRYRVQVTSGPGFSPSDVDQGGLSDTTLTLTTLRPDVQYRWRVQAVDAEGHGSWSGMRTFTTSARGPEAVMLETPAAGARLRPDRVPFNWQALPDAEHYHFQLATRPDFSAPVRNDSTRILTTYVATDLLPDTVYYWRVRARDAVRVGPWSAVRPFETSPLPPPAVSLRRPEDGAGAQPSAVTFTWDAVPGATSYHLQVAASPAFSLLVFEDSTLSQPEATAGPLAYLQTYHWRVRAANGGGAGPWSPPRTFIISDGTALEPNDGLMPEAFALHPNFPNPFHAATTLRFDVPEPADVSLRIYDLAGRLVDVLVEGPMPPGRYEVRWEAGGRASGSYVCRFEAGAYRQSHVLALLQ